MKKILLILGLVICLISCTKPDKSIDVSNKNHFNLQNNDSPIPTKQVTETKPKIPVPKVSEFSQQAFFRLSDEEDIKKQSVPPFTSGEISFFARTQKAKVGDEVTAVPIQTDLENMTLKLKKVKKARYLDCTEEKTGSDFEFEDFVNKQLLEIPPVSGKPNEQPLDFLLIYPAVKNAKRLKTTELTKEMLPENVEIKDLIVAVDLNDDGDPDLLMNFYCCNFSEQCDCSDKYQKINGKWESQGMSEPC